PTFLETLDAVLSELCVEKVMIASEMQTKNPELYAEIKQRFAGIPIVEVAHEQFKLNSARSRAVVRTGEYKPYANIILQSGVTF
ncbi:MAG: D-ribose pyranase, partial [Oscillospiraceae bacterium]|nr:D-ribose pyranase [Oscillospiraceae bacterium]